MGFVLLSDRTKARLEDSIVSSAETRAVDVAALAEAGALPDSILSSTGDQHVQVVEGGRVVAGTFVVDQLPPLTDLQLGPGQSTVVDLPESVFDQIEESTGLIEDEGPYVLAAHGYEGGTVLVASSIDAAATAVNALRPLLWVGWPVTLAVVAITVWFLTGWALRPVEAMSEEADAISASELDRRLPVPPADDEITHLAATLNSMLARLETATVQQRRFVSDASHELKTPVATVRTMLEVAAREPGFADWSELLVGLGQQNDRLDSLVTDLLTLARFDEGALVGRYDPVDLDQVVGRVAEHMAQLHPDVHVAADVAPARVVGDERALERLITNLGTNACRHADQKVTFSCRVVRDRAIVLVSDDGPGIPAADRDRVFERFVRLDEARDRPEGGTGLGLAVARAVARSHQGSVQVTDTEWGTTMQVDLPAGEQATFSARS